MLNTNKEILVAGGRGSEDEILKTIAIAKIMIYHIYAMHCILNHNFFFSLPAL